MNFNEMSSLPIEQLTKKAKELRNQIFELKMKNSVGQLGNPLQIRHLRKDYARIQTALARVIAR